MNWVVKRRNWTWVALISVVFSGCSKPSHPAGAISANDQGQPGQTAANLKTAKRITDAIADVEDATDDVKALQTRPSLSADLNSALSDVGQILAQLQGNLAPFAPSAYSGAGAASDESAAIEQATHDLDAAGGELDPFTGTLNAHDEATLEDLLGAIDDAANALSTTK